jgi:tripartite-type tricarboxylate transporter receptor subunit TctC
MVLRLLVLAVGMVICPLALANAYPERPIRVVVPYAAGGATDVVARVLAEAMAPLLPQPLVIENRGGAGGMVGAEVVARAPADGHTVLFNNTGHAALRVLVPNPPSDPITSLQAIAVVAESPIVMLVANNVPANNLREFTALAEARPGQLDYGSSGGGGILQMAALLYLKATGVQLNEVPYRGGAPATLDLAAGRIAMMFDAGLTGFQTARGNQARAFAVTTAQRNVANPDIPTWREGGVDAEMSVWQAVFVPAATPRDRREALNAAINRALSQEALRKRLADLGADRILTLNIADSEAYLAGEVARWESLLKR